MVSQRRLYLATALLLTGATLSAVLLLQHHGESLGVSAVEELCGGSGPGCDVVNRSPYAEVAGVPLAALGLGFYASLAVLLGLGAVSGPSASDLAAAVALCAVLVALVVDLWLFGVQAFALKAYCALCLTTYAVNAAVLATLAPARRAFSGLRVAVSQPAVRVAVVGWVLASLAVLGGVAAAETALTARAAQRIGSMLGAPLPPYSGGLGEVDDVSQLRDQLRQAQQKAQQLQETLDDPHKLQKYLDDKAAREFDEAVPQKVDLAATPVKGPAQAPIQVVEYSDFLCPFCKNIAGAFASYLPQSGGRVAIHFKNYPLESTCNPNVQQTLHEGACLLALGGLCAQEQGRFWPYHDTVFGATLHKPGREDVLRLASEAGLDKAAFEACLSSSKARDRLAADVAEGKRVGVTATPTILINGKRLPRINDFLIAVDKESRRLGLPATAGSGGR